MTSKSMQAYCGDWRRRHRWRLSYRCLLNGITVNLYEPDPNASSKINEIMINAKLAFEKLFQGPVPPQGKLHFTDSIASAVAKADLIIEAVPERLDIKQSVYRDIESAAAVTR